LEAVEARGAILGQALEEVELGLVVVEVKGGGTIIDGDSQTDQAMDVNGCAWFLVGEEVEVRERVGGLGTSAPGDEEEGGQEQSEQEATGATWQRPRRGVQRARFKERVA
jgi:hypothetical protein